MGVFRSNFLTLPLLSSLILAPGIGKAIDLNIEPRIQTGVMYYEFEQKSVSEIIGSEKTVDNGFKLSSILPFVGVGTTIFIDRFFVDLYVQKAFLGSDDSVNALESPDFKDLDDPSLNIGIDSDFDREDFSISVGSGIGDYFAIFAGYRKSTTSFDNTYSVRQGATVTVEGQNAPFTLTGQGNGKFDFEQDGFFLGGAVAFGINKGGFLDGLLSFNLALAFLDGELDSRLKFSFKGEATVDGETRTTDPELVDTGTIFKGDTIGLNIGASWKGSIPSIDRLSYTIGLNSYSYDFDADAAKTPNLVETMIRLSGGLSYKF